MHNYYSNRGRAAPARGFMALFAIMLAMGLGLMARPAEAAPFAYVAIPGPPDAVSVIDTATTPRPWWPRSRWGLPPILALGSRSRRTGNMSMSRMAPTMYR
jgi:hypothetical protein